MYFLFVRLIKKYYLYEEYLCTKSGRIGNEMRPIFTCIRLTAKALQQQSVEAKSDGLRSEALPVKCGGGV